VFIAMAAFSFVNEHAFVVDFNKTVILAGPSTKPVIRTSEFGKRHVKDSLAPYTQDTVQINSGEKKPVPPLPGESGHEENANISNYFIGTYV
jgi:hypothetical protein